MKSYSLSGVGFPNLKVLTMKGRKGRFHPTGGCGGPMPNLNKKKSMAVRFDKGSSSL